MRITFIKPYVVKDGSGTSYAEGQTIECSEASANHFIVRGAALPEAQTKKATPADTETDAKGKAKK